MPKQYMIELFTSGKGVYVYTLDHKLLTCFCNPTIDRFLEDIKVAEQAKAEEAMRG